MLERLSEKFARKLINTGIISETDADLYVYGFFQLAMMILNIVTTLFLGILFQLLIPCILLNLIHPAVLFVLSVVVIWSLAPVEAENNPWEDTEKFIYRRKSRVILGIEIIAFVITLIFTKPK